MRKSLLLVVPLLLLACDREPTGPMADGSPSYDWMNNPDVGNLCITRFEGGIAVCWTDPDTGLRACHSNVPLGGGTEPDCGPQEVLDPIARQEVGLIDPDDYFASWLHVNQKGTAWITVRNTLAPGVCFGRELVAQGWGRVHYTDNDLLGFAPGDNNANSWGFGAQGALQTPGGETVRYTGQNRFRFNEAEGFRAVTARAAVH